MTHSLRILCKMDFPSQTVRFWDGSGPYMDADGHKWRQTILADGLIDQIESAINAEAYTLSLSLSGIPTDISNIAWQETEDGDVIDSKVTIYIQECDELDQPVGAPEVMFTGIVDDIDFTDQAQDENSISTVTIQIRNRFTLRALTSGVTLSDVDQKARSKVINPSAADDRICDRIPELVDKSIVWPAWG
jgi:hypothetical protein